MGVRLTPLILLGLLSLLSSISAAPNIIPQKFYIQDPSVYSSWTIFYFPCLQHSSSQCAYFFPSLNTVTNPKIYKLDVERFAPFVSDVSSDNSSSVVPADYLSSWVIKYTAAVPINPLFFLEVLYESATDLFFFMSSSNPPSWVSCTRGFECSNFSPTHTMNYISNSRFDLVVGGKPYQVYFGVVSNQMFYYYSGVGKSAGSLVVLPNLNSNYLHVAFDKVFDNEIFFGVNQDYAYGFKLTFSLAGTALNLEVTQLFVTSDFGVVSPCKVFVADDAIYIPIQIQASQCGNLRITKESWNAIPPPTPQPITLGISPFTQGVFLDNAGASTIPAGYQIWVSNVPSPCSVHDIRADKFTGSLITLVLNLSSFAYKFEITSMLPRDSSSKIVDVPPFAGPLNRYFYVHPTGGQAKYPRLVYIANNDVFVRDIDTICPQNCNIDMSQGLCTASVCVCEGTYEGLGCLNKICSPPCQHGICSSIGVCICDQGFTGGSCETKDNVSHVLVCDVFDTVEKCLELSACGWCATSKKCLFGYPLGPTHGTCPKWFYSRPYHVGLTIVCIIFLAIVALMFLNDAISSVLMDYTTALVLSNSAQLLTPQYLKESFWRDERSAKFWKLFEQLQFVGLFLFLNTQLPTLIVQFVGYFSWSAFQIPLLTANNEENANRRLSHIFQHIDMVGISSNQVFLTAIIWFFITVLVVTVLYAIYALVMWIYCHNKHSTVSNLLLSKYIYILTRLILIGQFPLVVASTFALRKGHSAPLIVAAVFCLLLFGVCPVLLNALIVWNKSKGLLFLHLKIRFGTLYSTYHYNKARFNIISLSFRLATGILFGSLVSSATEFSPSRVYSHIISLIVLKVIYIVLLVIFRPYLDQFHFILDIIINITQSVALGVNLEQKGQESAYEIVTIVCFALLFIACIVAYAHSWFVYLHSSDVPLFLFCGPSFYHKDEEDKAQITKQAREELQSAMPANASKHVRDDDSAFSFSSS